MQTPETAVIVVPGDFRLGPGYHPIRAGSFCDAAGRSRPAGRRDPSLLSLRMKSRPSGARFCSSSADCFRSRTFLSNRRSRSALLPRRHGARFRHQWRHPSFRHGNADAVWTAWWPQAPDGREEDPWADISVSRWQFRAFRSGSDRHDSAANFSSRQRPRRWLPSLPRPPCVSGCFCLSVSGPRAHGAAGERVGSTLHALMGIVLAALAVQYVLNGISATTHRSCLAERKRCGKTSRVDLRLSMTFRIRPTRAISSNDVT